MALQERGKNGLGKDLNAPAIATSGDGALRSQQPSHATPQNLIGGTGHTGHSGPGDPRS